MARRSLYHGRPLTLFHSECYRDLRITVHIIVFSISSIRSIILSMADTYQLVQSCYGDIAKKTATSLEQNGEKNIAMAFGYSEEDLLSLPEKTNLGLSCGNPVAYANVKEGETIVDLGSGGGIDVFLAARKVGPTGKAIGIDMTKDMIDLATKNAKASGLSNTSFVEASITSIPLPDSSVDCIISNCVINLVPAKDKGLVFHEIARLLKPGGRLAVSDILARKELPKRIVDDMALYVGCIAGASQIAEYEEYLRQAGFQDILLVDTKANLNLYKESSYLQQSTSCCTPSSCSKPKTESANIDYNEWADPYFEEPLDDRVNDILRLVESLQLPNDHNHLLIKEHDETLSVDKTTLAVREKMGLPFTPLEELDNALKYFFRDGPEAASYTFDALRTAVVKGKTNVVVDEKRMRYMGPIVARLAPWSSCKLACTLVLLFASPSDQDSMLKALRWQSASLGGLPTMAEISSTPSADLPRRFTQAKKAAIDGKFGKVTVLGVDLVDVEMIERGEKKSKYMDFTSFAHNFVLAIGREGFREDAKDFMKTFKKLTRAATWSPELNAAYKELFDVDLDWVCSKERLQPPLVPIYRPWVRLFEIEDVQVDNIKKFGWETVEEI
ncbi:putative arsenite methyltransferase [Talaromyces pinophilus]|nr:putative arsenite methyltransferase [Talaromyces pinophilus]